MKPIHYLAILLMFAGFIGKNHFLSIGDGIGSRMENAVSTVPNNLRTTGEIRLDGVTEVALADECRNITVFPGFDLVVDADTALYEYRTKGTAHGCIKSRSGNIVYVHMYYQKSK